MVQTAVEQAAADAGYISRVYVAADNTEEALEDVFKQVSDDKIKLAVAYGEDMEIPVWNAQKNHRKVKFALIDGIPKKAEGESDEIRDNTLCAFAAYEDMGFLAGYAAVKNGSRKLAFIAGEKNDLNIRYAGGFVQGCMTAASEMSLGNDAVKITGVYSGSDELTPLRMSDALNLYGDGAEIIFTVGENIGTAVGRAASVKNMPFISGGADLRADNATCLFSVIPSYAGISRAIIRDFEGDKTFRGGETVSYGIADDSVELAIDYSDLTALTQGDIDSVVARIKSGEITVSAEEVTAGSAQVSLEIIDPPSASAAGSTGAAGTDSGLAAAAEPQDESVAE
jgi:basic membrane protein A